jgi:toxin-antitoxin system PIN domain toxin
VKLVDVNLLIYAVDVTAPKHQLARRWLEAALSGTEPVGFPWLVLLAFVRLSTRSAVFAQPLSADEALDLVDGWLAQPCVAVVHPTERHATILRTLLADVGTAANMTSDAHLAALALEHGAVLYSSDADFSRFSGIRWVDPLRA